jgi:DNA-binding transcriptional ArsR family regulator
MGQVSANHLAFAKLAGRLKAIADPVRLAILYHLPDSAENCGELYNVSELADEIGVSQPTISYHLKSLKQAGLIHCRKMCRDVYYWVDHEAMTEMLNQFSDLLPAERAADSKPTDRD